MKAGWTRHSRTRRRRPVPGQPRCLVHPVPHKRTSPPVAVGVSRQRQACDVVEIPPGTRCDQAWAGGALTMPGTRHATSSDDGGPPGAKALVIPAVQVGHSAPPPTSQRTRKRRPADTERLTYLTVSAFRAVVTHTRWPGVWNIGNIGLRRPAARRPGQATRAAYATCRTGYGTDRTAHWCRCVAGRSTRGRPTRRRGRYRP